VPVASGYGFTECLPKLQGNNGGLRKTGYVAQIAPSYSLRGGTREILRGMVARGLGLR